MHAWHLAARAEAVARSHVDDEQRRKAKIARLLNRLADMPSRGQAPAQPGGAQDVHPGHLAAATANCTRDPGHLAPAATVNRPSDTRDPDNGGRAAGRRCSAASAATATRPHEAVAAAAGGSRGRKLDGGIAERLTQLRQVPAEVRRRGFTLARYPPFLKVPGGGGGHPAGQGQGQCPTMADPPALSTAARAQQRREKVLSGSEGTRHWSASGPGWDEAACLNAADADDVVALVEQLRRGLQGLESPGGEHQPGPGGKQQHGAEEGSSPVNALPQAADHVHTGPAPSAALQHGAAKPGGQPRTAGLLAEYRKKAELRSGGAGGGAGVHRGSGGGSSAAREGAACGWPATATAAATSPLPDSQHKTGLSAVGGCSSSGGGGGDKPGPPTTYQHRSTIPHQPASSTSHSLLQSHVAVACKPPPRLDAWPPPPSAPAGASGSSRCDVEGARATAASCTMSGGAGCSSSSRPAAAAAAATASRPASGGCSSSRLAAAAATASRPTSSDAGSCSSSRAAAGMGATCSATASRGGVGRPTAGPSRRCSQSEQGLDLGPDPQAQLQRLRAVEARRRRRTEEDALALEQTLEAEALALADMHYARSLVHRCGSCLNPEPPSRGPQTLTRPPVDPKP